MMSASVGLKRELDMAKAEGGIFEKEKVKKSKSDSDELEAAQAELAELKKQLEAEKKKASQSKTKEQGDEKNFELSKKRRVTVKLFNGTKLLVDIREFYEKNGEMLPGRKGISLTKEQWERFRDQFDQIDAAVEELSG
mmetsp:Transcript_5693/g.7206  ORF Transcript_5693/g.7206 Transcript_5693/m.7206 type:complete len:138 (-) Transcript_5693:802-1215(-)